MAFAVALIGTNMLAVKRFRHAAASSAELAAIQAVAASAASRLSDPTAVVRAALAYRRTVVAETRAVAPGGGVEQDIEMREADGLIAAARSAQHDVLAGQIARVAEREHREARSIAADMGALSDSAVWLAVFLGGATLGSSSLALFGLITSKRRLEVEVAARTAELVAADRSRRLFFAEVSHELRTPVTVMRGEAEVALAGPSSPEPLRDALDQIVASAEEMERRIADLLGLAQADDGQLRLEALPLDFVEVARSAALQAERQARAAAVTIQVHAAAPVAIVGDARWLRQALAAMLDNAIRYSPPSGRIDITICPDGADAVLEMADRGRGMSAQALSRAFDAYFCDEPARAGTGLGLALARWVVERHGGAIAAGNREDGGCVIAIRLPVAP